MAGHAEIIVRLADVPEVLALIEAAAAVAAHRNGMGECPLCLLEDEHGHASDCPIRPLAAALRPFRTQEEG